MNTAEEKQILSRFTTKELSHHLIHGYIHEHDTDKVMLSDVITVIEMFHGLYYTSGEAALRAANDGYECELYIGFIP